MRTLPLLLALVLAAPASGVQEPPSGRRLIDAEIAAKRDAAGLRATLLCDDAEFLRRVWLDIAGTIPTLEEAERFLSDAAPDKRARLIDDLLSSPGYARNWSHVWASAILGVGDVRLQEEVADKLPQALEGYFAKNMPFDEFARTVVAFQSKPRANPKEERDGLSKFYTELFIRQGKESPQFLGSKFTRVFLGYAIQCARCHDHPFDHWTQEEFYGMAAFFAGAIHQDFGVGERAPGVVKGLAIPDSKAPMLKPSFLESHAAPEKGETLRAAYARILTDPSTLQFARSAVNRVWASLFGRGFVQPVDQFNAEHPATHPELLDALAAEFRTRRYDLHWLIREICTSETYQRSARTKTRDRDHERHYAVAPVRPLRPEQLVDALCTAGGLEEGTLKRDRLLRDFRATLGYDFGAPGARYQGGIPSALLLLNGPVVAQATAKSAGTPTRLERILRERPEEGRRIEAIYLSALSRPPRPEERERCSAHVRARGDSGYADVFAALLNSSEFLLSH
jgi:hypothetical protein